ncbi:MAG: SsrA-binding protein SmpB [Tissierellia bacterium]|nr:SsrA-binding protein SmpB [Tissierellia bacterium]
MKEEKKIIANNKKARHDFFIDEVFEAGIVLKGTEVKSLRQGKVSVKESFCVIEKGEAFIVGMHISPYEFGNRFNEDPLRKRKLLLNRREINKILGKIKEKGNAFVPLTVYIKNGLVKVEVALARGKKLYDKREDIAKKDANKKIQQALKY